MSALQSMRRSRKGQPCPACGDTSGKCSTKPSPKYGLVLRCGRTDPNSLAPDGWAILGPINGGPGGSVLRPKGRQHITPAASPATSSSTEPGLTLDQRKRVAAHIRAACRDLSTDAEHRQARIFIEGKGAEFDLRAYSPVPVERLSELRRRVARDLEGAGIPRKVVTAATGSLPKGGGVLEWHADLDGRPVQARVSLLGGGSYVIAGLNTFAHVARVPSSDTLIVTEGKRGAAITAQRTGCHAIGVSGVGSITATSPALAQILQVAKKLGVARILLAPDAGDLLVRNPFSKSKGKPKSDENADRTRLQIAGWRALLDATTIPVSALSWDPRTGSGFDDALIALEAQGGIPNALKALPWSEYVSSWSWCDDGKRSREVEAVPLQPIHLDDVGDRLVGETLDCASSDGVPVLIGLPTATGKSHHLPCIVGALHREGELVGIEANDHQEAEAKLDALTAAGFPVNYRQGMDRVCKFKDELRSRGLLGLGSALCGHCADKDSCAAARRTQDGEVLLFVQGSALRLAHEGEFKGRVLLLDESPQHYALEKLKLKTLETRLLEEAQPLLRGDYAECAGRVGRAVRMLRESLEDKQARKAKADPSSVAAMHGFALHGDEARELFGKRVVSTQTGWVETNTVADELDALIEVRDMRILNVSGKEAMRAALDDDLDTVAEKIPLDRTTWTILEGLANLAHGTPGPEVTFRTHKDGHTTVHVGQAAPLAEAFKDARRVIVLSATVATMRAPLEAALGPVEVRNLNVAPVEGSQVTYIHVRHSEARSVDLAGDAGKATMRAAGLLRLAEPEIRKALRGDDATAGLLTFKATRTALESESGRALWSEHLANTLVSTLENIPIGHYGHDDTGSNAFEGCNVLIGLGAFCENLGSVQDEARALGLDPDELLASKKAEHLIQFAGRARAIRRPRPHRRCLAWRAESAPGPWRPMGLHRNRKGDRQDSLHRLPRGHHPRPRAAPRPVRPSPPRGPQGRRPDRKKTPWRGQQLNPHPP